MALGTPTAVVLELMTMGQQSAAHLGELLRAASPPVQAEHQALAAEIIRCCDRVIAAVTAVAADKKRKAMDPGATSRRPGPAAAMPSKRRVRGAEAHREVHAGTTADGFAWRKYGQKDINGSNHPRLYYRCSSSGEGCAATRRVQRSQEDPAAFIIAYYGEHTCGAGLGDACQQQRAAPAPPTVVDTGSIARGIVGADDWNRNSPLLLPLSAEHSAHAAPGDTSRRWLSPSSSSSYSSEVEVELGASPVEEFLDGNFDWEWETVVNSLRFGDLLQ
ncbi:putative WRKY transcription factor 46 [Hordeum vulgare]|uniref:WRKY domain-containing protein n=1 Tax=Hordeum vulgare subsp. vulgare TaxID=112509 RepID=A0A8I6XGW2_HORVV|nr:transcription factor WRKY19-like [Hordeum vulgare subsp. vulgare]KAE8790209.1 putative WRKY transcription factor 46 [Hordeum vulgare]KAI5003418.1 hypothetical protein ZWY2020_030578 [Hordeum vulgare]